MMRQVSNTRKRYAIPEPSIGRTRNYIYKVIIRYTEDFCAFLGNLKFKSEKNTKAIALFATFHISIEAVFFESNPQTANIEPLRSLRRIRSRELCK